MSGTESSLVWFPVSVGSKWMVLSLPSTSIQPLKCVSPQLWICVFTSACECVFTAWMQRSISPWGLIHYSKSINSFTTLWNHCISQLVIVRFGSEPRVQMVKDPNNGSEFLTFLISSPEPYLVSIQMFTYSYSILKNRNTIDINNTEC